MKRFLQNILSIFLIFSLGACSANTNEVAAPRDSPEEKISQRYVEAVEVLKNDLKDPTSMRIYGDILVVDIKETQSTMLSIVYDSKNSYGGYPGKSKANILLSPDVNPSYVEEDSEFFIDLRELYNSQEELLRNVESGKYQKTEEIEELLESTTFETISGEQMAKELAIEYYKN